MTSSFQQQQQQHTAKFRWTEKLTWRFIQLRRDHAKMFTGRKYSAQQGWEYILRQMRQEFPAIMSDVHYRVLKKKWSNLLQQYKELKNPVHGDKNRADDVSWPFYGAIDEVIASLSLSANNSRRLCRRSGANSINDDDDKHLGNHMKNEEKTEDENEDLNGQEFLCVSLSPDDVTPMDYERFPTVLQGPIERRTQEFELNRQTRRSLRIPRATELTIRPAAAAAAAAGAAATSVKRKNNLEIWRVSNGDSSDGEEEEENGGTTAARKSCKQQDEGLERRIVEFMEYTKKRDEENRSILMRMLEALQDIRNALR